MQCVRRPGKVPREDAFGTGLTVRFVVVITSAIMLGWLGVLPGSIFVMVIAMAPAAAQQDDLNAIEKRFNQFYAAGDYPAALMEAQKLEVTVQARFGVNHAGVRLGPYRNSEDSKANRIEAMKGPAESGQICSVGRRKIAKKIAKNKRCYANTLRPRPRMLLKVMKGG